MTDAKKKAPAKKKSSSVASKKKPSKSSKTSKQRQAGGSQASDAVTVGVGPASYAGMDAQFTNQVGGSQWKLGARAARAATLPRSLPTSGPVDGGPGKHSGLKSMSKRFFFIRPRASDAASKSRTKSRFKFKFGDEDEEDTRERSHTHKSDKTKKKTVFEFGEDEEEDDEESHSKKKKKRAVGGGTKTTTTKTTTTKTTTKSTSPGPKSKSKSSKSSKSSKTTGTSKKSRTATKKRLRGGGSEGGCVPQPVACTNFFGDDAAPLPTLPTASETAAAPGCGSIFSHYAGLNSQPSLLLPVDNYFPVTK